MPTSIRLAPETEQRLDHLASHTGRSKAYYLREIIESDSPYLGKGWPIWRTPEFPVVIRMRLGQRFAPEADHQGLLKRLEAYFETELRR